jgi:hypothetical protein
MVADLRVKEEKYILLLQTPAYGREPTLPKHDDHSAVKAS